MINKIINLSIVLFAMFLLLSCIPQQAKPVRTVSNPEFNPKSINKIAIFVQDGRNFRHAKNFPQRLVEDEFMTGLIEKGYSVPARSDIEKIMKEQQFQHSGLADEDAAKLGKILNVPAILIVSLTQYENKNSGHTSNQYIMDRVEATLSARLVSVEKTEVLWVGTYSARAKKDQGSNLCATIAKRIADSFPSRYLQNQAQ